MGFNGCSTVRQHSHWRDTSLYLPFTTLSKQPGPYLRGGPGALACQGNQSGGTAAEAPSTRLAFNRWWANTSTFSAERSNANVHVRDEITGFHHHTLIDIQLPATMASAVPVSNLDYSTLLYSLVCMNIKMS